MHIHTYTYAYTYTYTYTHTHTHTHTYTHTHINTYTHTHIHTHTLRDALVVGTKVRYGHHAVHGCVGTVLEHAELAWPLGVRMAPPGGERF